MKKMIALLLAAMLLPVLSASGAEDAALIPVTFCLDWTPNTNHTGVYAAQALGFYEEAGLDVRIVQPPEDGATLMCAAGQAQFSVTAQDSMAAALDRDDPLGVTAVAAVLRHHLPEGRRDYLPEGNGGQGLLHLGKPGGAGDAALVHGEGKRRLRQGAPDPEQHY